jgi:hypothetical protein
METITQELLSLQRNRPYLITGPQAAYQYHRWLAPLENLIPLQVYAEDVSDWRQMREAMWQVFEETPTTSQIQGVKKAIILDPTLESERYQRRWVIEGLTFIAPEDLCLDLIERARGETSLAEAVAILIAQRDRLNWDVLVNQAEQRRLARHLGAVMEALNTEAQTSLVSQEVIVELHHRHHSPPEKIIYPPGRHRSVPPVYQPITKQWGVNLVLPRYVISKVLLDFHLQPQGG